LEEAKEVLQEGNKEVAGRGKKNAREVGQLAAEVITMGCQVSMINKKYVKTRSIFNFNTKVKRLYISQLEDVTYQII
jgi:hypothetical protein